MNWEKFMLQVFRIKKYTPVILDFWELTKADVIDDENWEYIRYEDLLKVIWKSIT